LSRAAAEDLQVEEELEGIEPLFLAEQVLHLKEELLIQ
tara:strand:+ start:87 stop:200 length:114 start_codon:yes stop_codon:yes gene_type:complete